MERRKVLFNYKTIERVSKTESKIINHTEEKGFFLQFGIDTYDENYPCSCALIEDIKGMVHSVQINDFKFKEWTY